MEARVVIITGGSAGIGYATAKKFLSKGNKVVILSTNEEKGRRAEKQLANIGEVCWMKCDIASYAECENVVNRVINKYGKVDILVNNAGIVSKRTSFLDVDLDDLKRTYDVDVMGTVHMIHNVTKHMVKAESGVIINIGSICGKMANTESLGYHISKGAIEMLTKSLARELSKYKIRVVCAAPGWVHTEMIDDTVANVGGALHMKGRIIEPDEIAGAVYLLSLEEASAINGSTVMVDDGYTSFKGVEGRK